MIEDKDGCPQFPPIVSGEAFVRLNEANKLLREWFERQTVVYAWINMATHAKDHVWEHESGISTTHTARLIGVRPIRKESAEDVLRELVEAWADVHLPIDKKARLTVTVEFIERAKRVLGGG